MPFQKDDVLVELQDLDCHEPLLGPGLEDVLVELRDEPLLGYVSK